MQFAPIGTYVTGDEEVKLQACDNSNRAKLDDMITEYQLFHDRWIEGLKKLRDKEPATDQTVSGYNSNENEEMVRVWQVAAAVDERSRVWHVTLPLVHTCGVIINPRTKLRFRSFSFLGTVCRHVQC